MHRETIKFGKEKFINRLFRRLTALSVIVAFLSTQSLPASGAEAPVASSVSPAPSVSSITIPEEWGTVQEMYQGKSRQIVVYVQDAHAHYQAQLHISKILNHLAENHNMSQVAVEGAEGPVDLTLFQSLPFPEIREKILDEDMRAGNTAGVEFFAMTAGRPIALHGVDSDRYYLENVAQYAALARSKANYEKYLKVVRNFHENVKNAAYSEEARDFDRLLKKHRTGQIKIDMYVSQLIKEARNAGVKPEKYSQIDALHKKISSKAMSPKKEDQTRAIQDYYRDKTEAGRETATVNDPLEKKLKTTDERVHEFEDLGMKHLDAKAVIGELDELTEEVQFALARNSEERELVELDTQFRLIGDGLDLTLTREDVIMLKRLHRKFPASRMAGFLAMLAERHHIFVPALDRKVQQNLDKLCRDILYFYRTVKIRDSFMADNIKKAFGGQEPKIVGFVAGGFHTDGVAERFRSEDISYVVIQPNITESSEETVYRDLMLRWGSVLTGVAGMRLVMAQANFSGAPDWKSVERLTAESRSKLARLYARYAEKVFSSGLMTPDEFVRTINEQSGARLFALRSDQGILVFSLADLIWAVTVARRFNQDPAKLLRDRAAFFPVEIPTRRTISFPGKIEGVGFGAKEDEGAMTQEQFERAINTAWETAGEDIRFPFRDRAQAAFREMDLIMNRSFEQPDVHIMAGTAEFLIRVLTAMVFSPDGNYKGVFEIANAVRGAGPTAHVFRKALFNDRGFLTAYMMAHYLDTDSIKAADERGMDFTSFVISELGPDFDFIATVGGSPDDQIDFIQSIIDLQISMVDFLIGKKEFERARQLASNLVGVSLNLEKHTPGLRKALHTQAIERARQLVQNVSVAEANKRRSGFGAEVKSESDREQVTTLLDNIGGVRVEIDRLLERFNPESPDFGVIDQIVERINAIKRIISEPSLSTQVNNPIRDVLGNKTASIDGFLLFFQKDSDAQSLKDLLAELRKRLALFDEEVRALSIILERGQLANIRSYWEPGHFNVAVLLASAPTNTGFGAEGKEGEGAGQAEGETPKLQSGSWSADEVAGLEAPLKHPIDTAQLEQNIFRGKQTAAPHQLLDSLPDRLASSRDRSMLDELDELYERFLGRLELEFSNTVKLLGANHQTELRDLWKRSLFLVERSDSGVLFKGFYIPTDADPELRRYVIAEYGRPVIPTFLDLALNSRVVDRARHQDRLGAASQELVSILRNFTEEEWKEIFGDKYSPLAKQALVSLYENSFLPKNGDFLPGLARLHSYLIHHPVIRELKSKYGVAIPEPFGSIEVMPDLNTAESYKPSPLVTLMAKEYDRFRLRSAILPYPYQREESGKLAYPFFLEPGSNIKISYKNRHKQLLDFFDARPSLKDILPEYLIAGSIDNADRSEVLEGGFYYRSPLSDFINDILGVNVAEEIAKAEKAERQKSEVRSQKSEKRRQKAEVAEPEAEVTSESTHNQQIQDFKNALWGIRHHSELVNRLLELSKQRQFRKKTLENHYVLLQTLRDNHIPIPVKFALLDEEHVLFTTALMTLVNDTLTQQKKLDKEIRKKGYVDLQELRRKERTDLVSANSELGAAYALFHPSIENIAPELAIKLYRLVKSDELKNNRRVQRSAKRLRFSEDGRVRLKRGWLQRALAAAAWLVDTGHTMPHDLLVVTFLLTTGFSNILWYWLMKDFLPPWLFTGGAVFFVVVSAIVLVYTIYFHVFEIFGGTIREWRQEKGKDATFENIAALLVGRQAGLEIKEAGKPPVAAIDEEAEGLLTAAMREEKELLAEKTPAVEPTKVPRYHRPFIIGEPSEADIREAEEARRRDRAPEIAAPPPQLAAELEPAAPLPAVEGVFEEAVVKNVVLTPLRPVSHADVENTRRKLAELDSALTKRDGSVNYDMLFSVLNPIELDDALLSHAIDLAEQMLESKKEDGAIAPPKDVPERNLQRKLLSEFEASVKRVKERVDKAPLIEVAAPATTEAAPDLPVDSEPARESEAAGFGFRANPASPVDLAVGRFLTRPEMQELVNSLERGTPVQLFLLRAAEARHAEVRGQLIALISKNHLMFGSGGSDLLDKLLAIAKDDPLVNQALLSQRWQVAVTSRSDSIEPSDLPLPEFIQNQIQSTGEDLNERILNVTKSSALLKKDLARMDFENVPLLYLLDTRQDLSNLLGALSLGQRQQFEREAARLSTLINRLLQAAAAVDIAA